MTNNSLPLSYTTPPPHFFEELHKDLPDHLLYSRYLVPGTRYVFNLIGAVEAAKQRVTVEADRVWGVAFADDVVGMSETLEGLQKQTEKAPEYSGKWRVTVNVKMCAVVVCNEDKMNPVSIS